jgi:hypothetical protein
MTRLRITVLDTDDEDGDDRNQKTPPYGTVSRQAAQNARGNSSDDENSGEDLLSGVSDSDSDDRANDADEAEADEQELVDIMGDTSKVDHNAALYRIGLARSFRTSERRWGYKERHHFERRFAEWALKAALLTPLHEPDPLVCISDLPTVMRRAFLGGKNARGKEVPAMVNNIKDALDPDRIARLVPPDKEVRRSTNDLPKRFSADHYIRNSRSKEPDPSLRVVDISRKIYSIYHSNGEQT